jgi:hypothetical protein
VAAQVNIGPRHAPICGKAKRTYYQAVSRATADFGLFALERAFSFFLSFDSCSFDFFTFSVIRHIFVFSVLWFLFFAICPEWTKSWMFAAGNGTG